MGSATSLTSTINEQTNFYSNDRTNQSNVEQTLTNDKRHDTTSVITSTASFSHEEQWRRLKRTHNERLKRTIERTDKRTHTHTMKTDRRMKMIDGYHTHGRLASLMTLHTYLSPCLPYTYRPTSPTYYDMNDVTITRLSRLAGTVWLAVTHTRLSPSTTLLSPSTPLLPVYVPYRACTSLLGRFRIDVDGLYPICSVFV